MARRNIDAFLDAGVDAVVVNAAGCGAAMKEYDHLLRDDPLYAEKAKRFSCYRQRCRASFSAISALWASSPP